MNDQIKLVRRTHKAPHADRFSYLNLEHAKAVSQFHQSFPLYQPTPLVSLSGLAEAVGVGSINVKDESHRFGLNAFKVLGGSFAVGQIIAERLGLPMEAMDYATLTNAATREKLGELTFITATDGNHGRGIAWTASTLGHKSVVYMPKGSTVERLENIRAAGAEADILELNYDDAVRFAQEQAKANGWIFVQDTAWDGYEEIPAWIMQGYTTMAFEAYQQLEANGSGKPTHIFLQAGVGSMAASMAGFFAQTYGDVCPKIVIVEPNKADCLYRTARADDGKLHFVTDDMDTIMAGLACGEPSTIAWDVLQSYADAFISCPDFISAKGMRILANPVASDKEVISGESGSVGIGLLSELMTNPVFNQIKDKLALNQDSRVLFFNTEGDTDKAGYHAVVVEGKYPSYDEVERIIS